MLLAIKSINEEIPVKLRQLRKLDVVVDQRYELPYKFSHEHQHVFLDIEKCIVYTQ